MSYLSQTSMMLNVPGKKDPNRVIDAFPKYLDDALADYLFHEQAQATAMTMTGVVGG